MEKLWTAAEVARFLGIAEADVERLVREGQLTGYKLAGQFLRFRPDQVKQLKDQVQPIAGVEQAAVLERIAWTERVRDFLYVHDFYIVSFLLLIGLALYLLSSS